MNPMTNVKNTVKLNDRELELGLTGSSSSWHNDFKDSAWIFVGGLPYDLTEGDVVCVFSQYGEIVNINLVRDKGTGKSKGFCFLCYEDQRSTILAVDNLNNVKLLGRTMRVNHVADYKMPKLNETDDDITRNLREVGCAPTAPQEQSEEEELLPVPKKAKKEKKKKQEKKKKKKKKSKQSSASEDSDSESSEKPLKLQPKLKKERPDSGYDRGSGYRDVEIKLESDEAWRDRRIKREDEERYSMARDREGYSQNHRDREETKPSQLKDYRVKREPPTHSRERDRPQEGNREQYSVARADRNKTRDKYEDSRKQDDFTSEREASRSDREPLKKDRGYSRNEKDYSRKDNSQNDKDYSRNDRQYSRSDKDYARSENRHRDRSRSPHYRR